MIRNHRVDSEVLVSIFRRVYEVEPLYRHGALRPRDAQAA